MSGISPYSRANDLKFEVTSQWEKAKKLDGSNNDLDPDPGEVYVKDEGINKLKEIHYSFTENEGQLKSLKVQERVHKGRSVFSDHASFEMQNLSYNNELLQDEGEMHETITKEKWTVPVELGNGHHTIDTLRDDIRSGIKEKIDIITRDGKGTVYYNISQEGPYEIPGYNE